MHLIINKAETFKENEKDANLSDSEYTSMLNECSQLAGDRPFKPIFGVKMLELNEPVVYGMKHTPSTKA